MIKRTSLALTARIATAALLFAFGTTAHAAGSPFESFFVSLEGQWEGTGVVQQLNADGSMQNVNYEMQLVFSRADQQGTWIATNSLTAESGATSQNNAAYTVNQNDLLLVSAGGATEPVQVTEINSKGLTYQTQRTDPMTGRSYTFTFQTELDATGGTLSGHNTVQTNGVTIQDETFTAKKW